MSGKMGSREENDVEASITATTQSGSFVPPGKSARIQHLSAATGLILTYLIEIGVQIFLTIHFCESLIPLTLEWNWVWLVSLSLGTSSLVVSTISLIWVCQSLDFAGRHCGRLLCYVMHVFLLGIPWRYLKLAFAYDPADAQEFVALRIFQTYIQSLPLTSIHLASLITFHQSWTSVPVWLVAAESVSIVIALIIASYSTPLPSSELSGTSRKRATTRCFQENLKCSTSPDSKGDESDLWCRVVQIELNLLSRGLLLACRLVSLGLILVIIKSWTSVFLLAHILLVVTWVQVRLGSSSSSPGWTLFRSVQSSYVTFWDVTSTLCGELPLVTWSGPAALVVAENVGILILSHWQFQDLRWLVTGTAASILFGSCLFALLNLSRLTPWRTLFGTRVQKINVPSPSSSNRSHSSSFDGGETADDPRNSSSSSSQIEGDEERENPNPLITNVVNYTSISEKLMAEQKITRKNRGGRKREQEQKSPQWEPKVTPPPIGRYDVRNCSEVRLGQVETWVPDTCCNDSNGSSNSRNTNTLLEPTPLLEPDDNLDTLESTDFVFCFPLGANGHRLPNESPLQTSTPVEIKTASRVIMNIPKHVEKGSRCPCGVVSVPPEQNLIEDGPYGILFCETQQEESPGTQERIPIQSSTNRLPLKLRILCAKCFQNHDPLLTDCQEEDNEKIQPRIQSIMTLPSETTDYPSETEMTWTGLDEEEEDESVVTSLHSHTFSLGRTPAQMWTRMLPPWTREQSLPKEFTSREYVRTWLLTSQTLQRHQHYQQKIAKHSNKYKTIHLPRRHPPHPGTSSSTANRKEAFLERRGSPLSSLSQKHLFYKDLEIIV